MSGHGLSQPVNDEDDRFCRTGLRFWRALPSRRGAVELARRADNPFDGPRQETRPLADLPVLRLNVGARWRVTIKAANFAARHLAIGGATTVFVEHVKKH